MTDLKMLAIGLLAGLAITLPYIVYLIFAQERLNTQLDELLADIPNVCDGKEQYAFLAWAKEENYDMTEHPIHWLFTDPAMYQTRRGWMAAVAYGHAQAFGEI
jgi:hypothetical protein